MAHFILGLTFIVLGLISFCVLQRDKARGYFQNRLGWTVYENQHPKFFRISIWIGVIVSGGLILAGILSLLRIISLGV